RSRNH
ncbi:Isoleucine--tRNA ligase, partial [Haemophilus influenzae]